MAGRTVARGDIWQYRFAAPDKRRPVLVISRQVALDHLSTALIAQQVCVANLDHILSVRQSDLRRYIGQLDESRMREVCRAAAIALGCA